MAEGKTKIPYIDELKIMTGPKKIELEETLVEKAVARLSPSRTLKRAGPEVAEAVYKTHLLRRGKGKKHTKTRKVKRRRS